MDFAIELLEEQERLLGNEMEFAKGDELKETEKRHGEVLNAILILRKARVKFSFKKLLR